MQLFVFFFVSTAVIWVRNNFTGFHFIYGTKVQKRESFYFFMNQADKARILIIQHGAYLFFYSFGKNFEGTRLHMESYA